MRKLYAVVTIGLFPFFAACAPYVNGNGQLATESRALEGFEDVDSEGAFDVRVEQGDAFRVIVNIDSNLLRSLETRVRGRTLAISSYGQLGTRVPGPHVVVTMPHVASVALSGSGRLSLASIHETEPVTVRLSGSGDMDIQGHAPNIDAFLDGSGDINLGGTTDRATLGLSGSGTIDAAGLVALAGAIDLSGSGEIRATVNGPVDVSLGGSGDVDIFGDATLGRVSKSGSGSIHVH